MKELRFDADGGAWRIAFAFDTYRKAILLVGGDKSGVGQRSFYRDLIEDRGWTLRSASEGTSLTKEGIGMPVTLEEILNEMSGDRRYTDRAACPRDARGDEPARSATPAQTDPGAPVEETQDRTRRVFRALRKRTDLYISTLRSYVEGVGGKLKLVVELPDRPPVILSGLGEVQGEKRAKKKARNAAKSKAKTRRAA
jgi:hypothetical protein